MSGSVETGALAVTSAIAGAVIVDGVDTGARVKKGGSVIIRNVATGATEVAVRGNDGAVIKAPAAVLVEAGKTANARIERPAPVENPAVPSDMVRISGGTFMMGSPKSEAGRAGDETQHRVTVSGFYMGKYEVTQAEWKRVMGTNPSSFKGDNLPVECVSWFDAVAYCNKRSEMEGLTPAYQINGTDVTWNKDANGYRLPTEAEWEYACRAGTTTPFSTGGNITTNQANYDGNYPYNGNAKGIYQQKTTSVGSFAPNAWGLYDMHGNVWEWCWDWYGSYQSDAQTNPTGATSGSFASGSLRVSRGGSWDSNARSVRSAGRYHDIPDFRLNYLGFRLCRSL
jgi:formylglycine-generating enzyme required for sulfatase activity